MSEQMTLGDFIDALRKHAANGVKSVAMMFGGKPDTRVHSYRGYCKHAALGWYGGDYGSNHISAAELADSLEKQLGDDIKGWKGGDYVVQRSMPLWCSNQGNADRCAVVGISRYGRILIEYQDD